MSAGRPTSSHEHIFLLSKSRTYFFDADAVRLPNSENSHGGLSPNQHKQWAINQASGNTTLGTQHNGANLRNVWKISTHAFPEAHFATFPPEIPRRCIKAGTSERGCCAACGAPWVRVVETMRGPQPAERGGKNYGRSTGRTSPTSALGRVGGDDWYTYAGSSQTTGWSASCECDAEVVPCVVLDPFFGSGTTGLVADELGRDCIGVELNGDYGRMSLNRIQGASPMFARVTIEEASPPETPDSLSILPMNGNADKALSDFPDRDFVNTGTG